MATRLPPEQASRRGVRVNSRYPPSDPRYWVEGAPDNMPTAESMAANARKVRNPNYKPPGTRSKSTIWQWILGLIIVGIIIYVIYYLAA